MLDLAGPWLLPPDPLLVWSGVALCLAGILIVEALALLVGMLRTRRISGWLLAPLGGFVAAVWAFMVARQALAAFRHIAGIILQAGDARPSLAFVELWRQRTDDAIHLAVAQSVLLSIIALVLLVLVARHPWTPRGVKVQAPVAA